MKVDLRERRVSARELLTDVPTFIQRMTVYDFLRAQPGLGRERGRRICGRLNIRPSKYLGELSERLRTELILAVEAVGGHSRRTR